MSHMRFMAHSAAGAAHLPRSCAQERDDAKNEVLELRRILEEMRNRYGIHQDPIAPLALTVGSRMVRQGLFQRHIERRPSSRNRIGGPQLPSKPSSVLVCPPRSCHLRLDPRTWLASSHPQG